LLPQARKIRGFCHLYDGQEAIAAGLQAALTKDDNIISSYRCHALQYIRGDTVKRIVGELFGFELVCGLASAPPSLRWPTNEPGDLCLAQEWP
jgi:TPP-dependent pyruvate/acetoin dehydrogenase alpha subunit